MKHLSERKKLVKELDKVFSLYIRTRDRFTCVVCGSKERVQCGHLFSRASHSTRWDELNAHAQCSSCNIRHEYDYYPFDNWFVKKFGQQAKDNLHFKTTQSAHFKDFHLQEMIEKYKQLLTSIQN